MIESTAKAPTSTTEAMAEALSDLHGQAVLLVVPALIVAAGLLAAMAEASTSTVEVYTIAAGLSALALTVWTLSRITYGGAVAASVLGTTLAVVVLVTYAKTVSALPLLALPIGLTVLLVNVRVGGLFALAASILLIFPPAIVPPVDLSLRILTILQLWGTLALTSVVERKLFTLAEWAWSHYERNRELLDEARDYQLEAKQTLKDLAAACQQLAELNQYVGRLRQEAEDARRAKEQFVANVSHELRTPLNMIIGFTELITTSPRNYGARIPTKLLADLEIILRNSRHLADLINDVLDLSQIEANRMALTKERVDIDEILDAAATAV
ncbi:MAG: hypothetical protein M1546_14840, partial [Chloroflexi bacterium]|nr:hypothetical protein [Chloroflexota bacterium]